MKRKGERMTIAETDEIILRKKAVKYIQQEIEERYRLENVRKVLGPEREHLIRDVAQEDIDVLKEMFLTTIYPEYDARRERDKSFESLIRMLKTPSKLMRMIPSMPVIALRYATIFPVALRIGLNSIIAFTRSNRLENKFVANLLAIYGKNGKPITNSMKITRDEFLEAYRGVSYTEGKKMISVALWVVHAGKRRVIVESAKSILKDVRETLEGIDRQNRRSGRRQVYTDDIVAIEYGIRTLDRIAGVFKYFSPEKIDRLIEVARIIEIDYMNRNYGVS
ncbi:MAG: hypothetical protein AB1742_03230 [bacterium]